MDRLYSQPDVMREILSYLSPQEILSSKLIEKKSKALVKLNPKDKKLLDAFREIAVIIAYQQMFNQLYFNNENDQFYIYATAPERVKEGRKDIRPFEIILERIDGKFVLYVTRDRNRKTKIQDPDINTSASVISKFLFDPEYQKYKYDEFIEIETKDPYYSDEEYEIGQKVSDRTATISKLVDRLIGEGDINRYLERKHVSSQLQNLIIKKYRNLIKSNI